MIGLRRYLDVPPLGGDTSRVYASAKAHRADNERVARALEHLKRVLHDRELRMTPHA